jgi:CRP-like cAMP-binding protein
MSIDQTVTIFPDLTNPDIEQIKSFASKKQCTNNELIFSEGDEANSFYIIDKGRVSVTYDDNGDDKVLCILSDNDYFGEMAIYNHDKRCATVMAIEDTLLLEIEKEIFLDFVESHPVLSKKITNNLAIRNEELILRESLVDMTGLKGRRLNISIKGDPSLRESVFDRGRYESMVDKVMDKLRPNLEELLLNRCVYNLFVNFNSGEIRTSSIFDPFVDEIHTSDKLIEKAYIDRHFPEINYEEKAKLIKSMYQFISSDHSFNQLPVQWKNIIGRSHNIWEPIEKEEIKKVMAQLGKLRSIESFYLRNISISMVLDAIRMQFNCDGTHIVSAEDYQQFLVQNLEE